MKFDKSKFKKQSIEEVEAEVKQAQKTMAKGGKSYTGFAKVEKGKNVFRVAPAMGKAYVACKMSKLRVEVPTYDENGNVTGKEVKDKNVFCADVHGKNVLKGKDPIVTYCDYVKRKASEEYQDDKERTKYLNPVNGYRKGNKFVWGINPSLAYICYVYQGSKDFARLQLYGTWMNRIKEISIEQSDDDTVSFDIFSQLEGAYPLVITAGEDDKGKKTYSISAGMPNASKKQTWDEFFEETAIPDEDMEYFLNEVPTLEEVYKDVYSAKDFNMALDGLRRFDEENGYDIFADDAFLSEIEEMAALIPDEDEKKEAVKKPAKKTAKEAVEEESDDEEEEVKKPVVKKNPASKKAAEIAKYPPLSKMKKILEEYIAEEYPEMELPEDLSVAEIRSWYDLAQAGEALPFPEDEEETADEEEVSVEDEEVEVESDEPTDDEAEDEPKGEESPIDEEQTDEDNKRLEAQKRLQELRNRMKAKK